MSVEKACANCGKIFSVKSSRAAAAKYCSRECKAAVKSRSLICVHCGQSFVVPQRRSETVKFCSWECRVKAGSKDTSCLRCGTHFAQKQNETRRYCSTACFHATVKGVPKKPRPDALRYYRTCEECSKSFRVTLTRKDTARFCSRTCQSKNVAWRQEQSAKQGGEKHWRWKGGEYKYKWGYVRTKTKHLDSEIIRTVHRIAIEQAMLEVASDHPFLVMVNGEKHLDRNIEVHHIDRNRSNNALDNLLAVTKTAHARIHHKNEPPKPWECWPPNPPRW